MKVITPESDGRSDETYAIGYTVFLAGTIDNGYSNNW